MMPCEMLRCKFFHKSHPAPRGPEQTQWGLQTPVQLHQQSFETPSIHLQSMPPQGGFNTTYRGPLPDPLEFQQAGGSSQVPRKACRPIGPLMDLSSLEGPPIDDTRIVRARHSMIPRPPGVNSTTNDLPPNLLWKPLPPRPASAEPASSRQRYQPYRPAARPTECDETSRSDNSLRQGPAQRNRHSHTEHGIVQSRPSPEYERSRPTSTIIQRQTGPRSRSSDPLVWLEDAGQWVIASSSARRSSPQPRIHPLPTRLRNATSPPLLQLHGDSNELEGRDNPPDYESHCFSPTHVMRLTFGPASRPRASACEN